MESLDPALAEDRSRGRGPIRKLQSGLEHQLSQVPWLRRLPAPAVGIVILLVLVQVLVWAVVAIVLRWHRNLIPTAVLAYTLGLRHALDADHISAIDLTTRRLMAAGQRPVTVGTFFSLGHSTIVLVTAIVVAASAAAIKHRFGSLSTVGSIIGSGVSAGFLLLLGGMNGYILFMLVRQLRRAIAAPDGREALDFSFQGRGCMMAVLRNMFKLIDRPWKMYPLGVLFGLGFDTSSEVALLGISAIEAKQGTSFWLILIFPILFTTGMCLLDTFDGAAMMSLYSSARLAKDPIAVLYYQSVFTAVTVVVALVIGVIQLLSLILAVKPELGGRFWNGVAVAGDNYDVIGGGICGSFVVAGVASVLLYRPWRRRVDRWRAARLGPDVAETEEGADGLDGRDIEQECVSRGIEDGTLPQEQTIVTCSSKL